MHTGQVRETEIAVELGRRLAQGRYLVTRIEVDADDLDAALAERPDAVVAIGREAVARARSHLPGQPIVFCQVLDAANLLDGDPKVWGVGAEPPVELQLKAWKAAHPSLDRIGLIVSETRAGRASEAVAAARAIGAEVTVSRSGSDRETLYLFKRMAPRIDGFWLFPDHEILSPRILRELLDYALSHEVGVLAFSDALLPWGAVFSAQSRAGDVAARVHDVLDRVLVGDTRALPRLTPLSEVELDFNYEAARRLGLALAAETSWVIREAD